MLQLSPSLVTHKIVIEITKNQRNTLNEFHFQIAQSNAKNGSSFITFPVA